MDTFNALEAERKAIQTRTEELQSKRNSLSKQIGMLKGKGEDTSAVMAEVAGIGDELKANETALAWRFALRQVDAPTGLALSRQGLPILDPDSIPDDAIERGAYVLRETDSNGDGEPDLILIATGSEVSLCIVAADQLESEGVATRVVSMPCMETFAEQDESYRDEVLPPSVHARLAVEAAARFGWDRWIGPDGEFLGMKTFGESGPAKDVYEHFGITADHAAEIGKHLLARVEARSGA